MSSSPSNNTGDLDQQQQHHTTTAAATLGRWLRLLNDSQAAAYYNQTAAYWPPADEPLGPWTLRHGVAATWALCLAYAAICVCGCVGNAAVVWLVGRTPALRTTTNRMVVSLAAADLMVNCFCLPFTLAGNVFKGIESGCGAS